jgi:hypothetical protein
MHFLSVKGVLMVDLTPSMIEQTIHYNLKSPRIWRIAGLLYRKCRTSQYCTTLPAEHRVSFEQKWFRRKSHESHNGLMRFWLLSYDKSTVANGILTRFQRADDRSRSKSRFSSVSRSLCCDKHLSDIKIREDCLDHLREKSEMIRESELASEPLTKALIALGQDSEATLLSLSSVYPGNGHYVHIS